MIRSFIAINLPQYIKEYLGRFRMKSKKTHQNVKWVDQKNFHLTLQFLGNQNKETLKRIVKLLDKICLSYKPFYLRIKNLDCFPNINNPRIIFAKCDGDINILIDLQNKISQELKTIDIKTNSTPWKSHITLARIKKSIIIQLPKLKNNLKFQVASIDLMKSDLTAQGPIYSVLKSFRFKN